MPIDVGGGPRIGPSHVNVNVRPRGRARAYQQTIRPSNVSVAPRIERQVVPAQRILAHGLNIPGLSPQIQSILPDVLDAAHHYNLDPALLLGQEEQESGFNPGAVSSANAGGISQFIPSTAREYGVQFGTSKKAVRSQIEGQAHYMSDLGARTNPTEALNRYLGVGGSAPTSYSSNILTNAQGYGSVTRAARKQARAQQILAQAGLAPGGRAGAPAAPAALASGVGKGPYINPYGSPTEIDMGVDYGGTGPIGAIGRGHVVGESSFGGGPYLAYQLDKGPRKGWTVYVAEGIQPTVRPGQVVKKGQVVANQSSGIETGWAASPKVPYQGGAQTLAQATGDPRVAGRHSNFTGAPSESDPVAGRDFLKFLEGKPSSLATGAVPAIGGYPGAGTGGSGVGGGGTGGGSPQQQQTPAVSPLPAYQTGSGISASAAVPMDQASLQASLEALLSGGSTAPQAGSQQVPSLADILLRQRFRPRR